MYLTLPGTRTITLSDSRTIAALFSSGDNALTIVNDGALTLLGSSGGSTLNGGLQLQAGGTLSVEGAGAVLAGGYSQEGGLLSGAGSLTLQGNANSWQGGTWAGGGTTTVAPGSRLLIGSLDTATNPTLLNGRDLSVGSAGRLELASDLEVQGGTNTLSLASGARLAFTNGLGGYPGLLVHAGRLDLEQAGSLQVESGVNAQLGTTASGAALGWTSTGPVQIDSKASLALYTRPYDADLDSEGVVASLSGPLSVAPGSALASTSSALTITPGSPSAFQVDGGLTVNGGSARLATAAAPNASLGSLTLIDGSLRLEGPPWPGGRCRR